MQWTIWAVCKQLLLFPPSRGEVPSGLGCSSSLRSWLLGSGVLICTAAAQGAWCLFLTPLVAKERRVRLLRHRVFYKLPPSRHRIKLFIPGGPGTSMRNQAALQAPHRGRPLPLLPRPAAGAGAGPAPALAHFVSRGPLLLHCAFWADMRNFRLQMRYAPGFSVPKACSKQEKYFWQLWKMPQLLLTSTGDKTYTFKKITVPHRNIAKNNCAAETYFCTFLADKSSLVKCFGWECSRYQLETPYSGSNSPTVCAALMKCQPVFYCCHFRTHIPTKQG